MTRAEILDAARQAITVDRAATHGNAEDSFAAIAGGWNWWLAIRADGPLTPLDVAVMMDLLKTARIAGNPAHADNYIDKVGYSAIASEMGGKA